MKIIKQLQQDVDFLEKFNLMDYSLLFAVEQINFRNSVHSTMDSSNNMIKQLMHDLASDPDPKQIQR